MWLSPYLGPAHSGNIHRPMKKVRFTSLTLAAATSSIRPSRPRCAPRRRAPDALAQIPAPCSGALALRPSGPDAPGHLAASPAPCCRLQWRRPRPPAFIPGSAPRRLPVSAPCLGASPPPRLPAAARAQPAAPSPAPRSAAAASGTPSPHPSAPYPLPPSLGHSQISITELLTHCSRN